MTKERFCKILKKIEATVNLEYTLYDLTCDYCREYQEDIHIDGIFYPMMTETIELLSEIMHDEADDINYFCWDLGFGKRWEPGMIINKNGDDIDFSTAEKLYDYLEGQK